MPLYLRTIVNNPVESNCHILYDDCTRHCIIIDPGSENVCQIVGTLEELSLNPDYIFLTHEHFDHMWSCTPLVNRYSLPIVCSKKCSEEIQDRKKNLSIFYNQVGIVSPAAELVLENINWVLDWQSFTVRFYDAPGHSDGGVIIVIGKYLFTGDTLMKDTPTPTKFRCSSKDKLKDTFTFIESLKGNKFLVCPGHGENFNLDDYDLSKSL